MDYELSIDMPNLAKGAEVQIAGLGTFENGSTYKITDEEHDSFRRYHGRVETTTNDNNEIVGSELVVGPTLIQASDNMYGVSVKQVKETAAEKKQREEAEAAAKAEAEALAKAEQEKAEAEAQAIADANKQEGEGS